MVMEFAPMTLDEPAECLAPDMSPAALHRLRAEVRSRAAAFARLAERHAVLASETRLKILSLLGCVPELCVCDLATVLELTPAAVSQHLSRLRSAGLVRARRDGMNVHYSLAADGWSPLAAPPRLEPPAAAPAGGPDHG